MSQEIEKDKFLGRLKKIYKFWVKILKKTNFEK